MKKLIKKLTKSKKKPKKKFKSRKKNPNFRPLKFYLENVKDYKIYKNLSPIEKFTLANAFQNKNRFNFKIENYEMLQNNTAIPIKIMWYTTKYDKYKNILGVIEIQPNEIIYYDFTGFPYIYNLTDVTRNLSSIIGEIIEHLISYHSNYLSLDVEGWLKTLNEDEKKQIFKKIEVTNYRIDHLTKK